MATNKLFSVAGTSVHPNGELKMRFANDLVSRIKNLTRSRHTEIFLFELGGEFNKLECVNKLIELDLLESEEQKECAARYIAKNTGGTTVEIPVIETEQFVEKPVVETEQQDADAMKEKISDLLMQHVANEDSERPYTDEDLSVFLQSVYGITISRKTVGKMRKELGIPSSVERAKQ